MLQPEPRSSLLSRLRKRLPVLAFSTLAADGLLQARGRRPPQSVAITEWDSLEQAQAFYNSKAWKDLTPQREKAVKTTQRYIVEAAK
jgi:uncharacterized protein (DUF1330 family)